MEEKKKYAEQLQERYESEEKYNEMSFDEYVRKEIATCDQEMRETIMQGCADEEAAIDEFVMMCEYLYK